MRMANGQVSRMSAIRMICSPQPKPNCGPSARTRKLAMPYNEISPPMVTADFNWSLFDIPGSASITRCAATRRVRFVIFGQINRLGQAKPLGDRRLAKQLLDRIAQIITEPEMKNQKHKNNETQPDAAANFCPARNAFIGGQFRLVGGSPMRRERDGV